MIELTETIGQISSKINQALVNDINMYLVRRSKSIENKCKNLVSKWISAQPEIESLTSGLPSSLAGQFGLIPGSESFAIKDIIESVENSISLTLQKFDNKLNGGLYIYFQPSNFANLLGLSSGHTFYRDGDLHWMDWLLNQGDRIIVVNYSYNPQTGVGRSKLGNMVNSGSFRVPPEFSGTPDDNFITRALIGRKQESEIFNIIMKELS